MIDTTRVLPSLKSRQDYFDYLDGYSVEANEQLAERHTATGLVKSYMLETVREGDPTPTLQAIFSASGVGLEQVDAGLYTVSDRKLGGKVGLLEVVNSRHPVLYTLLNTDQSQPWINRIVQTTPWLDHLWLSAPIFQELWRYVQDTADPHRFTRMSFEYTAYYESEDSDRSGQITTDNEPDDEEASADGSSEDRRSPERRASRFTMVDRVRTIGLKLPTLSNTYHPLYSITQLRVPAAGRGGHDFYFDGRVTNRGDSFADHRLNVQFVIDAYRRITERAESDLWVTSEESTLGDSGFNLRGAAVYMKFSEPLDSTTFDRWITATFARKRNRFRLSGHPFRLGPTKVHVYGLDRHLWQPLLLEITNKQLVAVLPRGTCGNTIHRLVTNVQRMVDPAVETWVGDQPYGELVQEALHARF
jgi:hypothetical protein